MSIEVVEAAPSTKLTSLATVKYMLGITDSVAERDQMLDDMIQAASDFVCNYCGRQFALQTVKESLPGKGVPELLLSLTPIVEVTSVFYKDTAYTDFVVLDKDVGVIQSTGCSFRDTSFGYPSAIDRFPSAWAQNNWIVTYQGGYVLPGWGESQGVRNLPYDLERAVLEMVKSTYRNLGMDGTMKSYKIGDTTIVWDKPSSVVPGNLQGVLPNSAIGVLNYYRRAF